MQKQEVISQWHNEIKKLNHLYKESFSGLDNGLLNKPRNDGGWSVAQNISHVIRLNQSYFKTFEKVEKGQHKTPLLGYVPFYPKIIGNTFLKYVDANRSKSVGTLPPWKPADEHFDSTVLEDFLESQELFRKHIEKLEGQIFKKKIIASPITSLIVFHLETAIDILLEHEERHFNQALATVNELQES